MSHEAAESYRQVIVTVCKGEGWQEYLQSECLSPLPINEAETRDYWAVQVQNHRELLNAIAGES